MHNLNDLSRSLVAVEPDGTLICVIELSLTSWLVAGIVPGVERQPLKKLAIDENASLMLLHRWRAEAEKASHKIKRIGVGPLRQRSRSTRHDSASVAISHVPEGQRLGTVVSSPH